MTEVETLEKEALALLLRSKTALVRLTDAEVHSVLAFLESIGFARPAATADTPPILPVEPVVVEVPPVVESVAVPVTIEPPPTPPAPPAPVVAPAP